MGNLVPEEETSMWDIMWDTWQKLGVFLATLSILFQVIYWSISINREWTTATKVLGACLGAILIMIATPIICFVIWDGVYIGAKPLTLDIKQEWSGVSYQNMKVDQPQVVIQTAMIFFIEEINGNVFHGHISWPNFPEPKYTDIQGGIEKNRLFFVEHKSVKGYSIIPTYYEGIINSEFKSISGEWKNFKEQGTFNVNLIHSK
jgi:hypothetical protein